MKRIVPFVLAVSLLLSGCTKSTDSSDSGVVQETKAEKSEESKARDLQIGDYTEMGEGTAYLSTASGTSENGNIPFIYDEGYTLCQIGFEAWEFNGDALSFIYVDGMLLDKMQLSNSQTSLTLMEEQLSVGVHTVEVVQYENDDPASAMTVYKSMQYEVKKA